jgi:hypothetical protein
MTKNDEYRFRELAAFSLWRIPSGYQIVAAGKRIASPDCECLGSFERLLENPRAPEVDAFLQQSRDWLEFVSLVYDDDAEATP